MVLWQNESLSLIFVVRECGERVWCKRYTESRSEGRLLSLLTCMLTSIAVYMQRTMLFWATIWTLGLSGLTSGWLAGLWVTRVSAALRIQALLWEWQIFIFPLEKTLWGVPLFLFWGQDCQHVLKWIHKTGLYPGISASLQSAVRYFHCMPF